jgi:hypothetical protein
MHWSLRRILVVVVAFTFATVFVSSAFAASYWFYQGYLPRPSNGDRFVWLGSNPPPAVYQRESWAACTHNMKLLEKRKSDGGWSGVTLFYSNGCDQEMMEQYPEFFDDYGCENPVGLSQVYVNCRAGTNP